VSNVGGADAVKRVAGKWNNGEGLPGEKRTDKNKSLPHSAKGTAQMGTRSAIQKLAKTYSRAGGERVPIAPKEKRIQKLGQKRTKKGSQKKWKGGKIRGSETPAKYKGKRKGMGRLTALVFSRES